MRPEDVIGRAAQLIRDANHAIALTGAGVSTPSGIPDFRSIDSGLWANQNPTEVASLYAFKRHPQAFYDWIRPLARTVVDARPNPAHTSLAQMERSGHIKRIITQNIDMLHSKAGSDSVCEVHGQFRVATCIECFAQYDADPIIRTFLANGTIPRCTKCNGVLKPNVILFGEQLPVRQLFAAQQEARKCDLMLVAGSSLQVAPIGDLPDLARQHGALLIIINYMSTHMDGLADIVIRSDVATILPKIAARVAEAL